MAGRLEGKVALVSGGARSQGRSHALKMAAEGADIITFDICAPVASVPYDGASEAELAETVSAVEALDRRIVARKVDVRDYDAVKALVDDGVEELGGRLDIVAANAGAFAFGQSAATTDEQEWDEMLDINVKGVWHTTKIATPHMIAAGNGGSIVITSSTAGIKGTPFVAAYTTSKHAVGGLAKTLALELGEHRIRVNTVHPTSVNTIMVLNDPLYRMFAPDLENPTQDDFEERMQLGHALPTPYVTAEDISNAIVFLCSDEARFITGQELKVDAGYCIK